jgi:L-alanine-DL-glutamate epimerase-like enolase superfamily enzyme
VHDFRTDAAALAKDLLASGIRAMKIWPFDEMALANRGQRISAAEIERGLAPLRAIRDAVGGAMDVALEFHGYWNLPSAIAIARASEPYRPLWLEELLPQDNLAAYAQLRQETALPLILSERLMTRWQFREVLDLGIAQFVNPDLCWCGGLTEAREIAAHADTAYVPIAPHNCGGPVLHAASVHLAPATPNPAVLESVRRHYPREYDGIVSGTPVATDESFAPAEAPELGVALSPRLLARADMRRRKAAL